MTRHNYPQFGARRTLLRWGWDVQMARVEDARP